jgi:hypothetical protein
MEGADTARPSPRLAFWLSMLVPGLGLVYAGAPLRGLVLAVLAFLGFAGIMNGLQSGAHRPEYVYYGIIGAALLAAAWWGGARHAKNFAARRDAWPPLYRFFLRPQVRQPLRAARVELAMALLFAAFVAIYLTIPTPRWLPEPPRYWFLYEVFGAFYIAAFHSVLHTLHLAGGRSAAKMRSAGFFFITLLATLLIALFSKLPRDSLVLAYLLALPSCWYSLAHRGEEVARMHWARFIFCVLAAFLAAFAFAIVLEVWELVSGERQYQMRLIRDADFSMAVFALLYYLVRAAFEALLYWNQTLVELPNAGPRPDPGGGAQAARRERRP